MQYSCYAQHTQCGCEDSLAATIRFDQCRDGQGEWNILSEVGLGATCGEETVRFAGCRRLGIELGDALLGADAIRDDAVLQPGVVAGERQCEGGCDGEVQADVDDVGW